MSGVYTASSRYTPGGYEKAPRWRREPLVRTFDSSRPPTPTREESSLPAETPPSPARPSRARHGRAVSHRPGEPLGTTDVNSRHTALRENVSRIDIRHPNRGDTPPIPSSSGAQTCLGRPHRIMCPYVPANFCPRWMVSNGTVEPVIPDSQGYQDFEDNGLVCPADASFLAPTNSIGEHCEEEAQSWGLHGRLSGRSRSPNCPGFRTLPTLGGGFGPRQGGGVCITTCFVRVSGRSVTTEYPVFRPFASADWEWEGSGLPGGRMGCARRASLLFEDRQGFAAPERTMQPGRDEVWSQTWPLGR